MAQCPVCKDPIDQLDKPRTAHLVMHRDGEGHVHVHGDLNKKDDMKAMLDAAGEELGIVPSVKSNEIPNEIVFHNRQRIGDMLMFTCAIRDFKKAFPHVRVNVKATAMHIFDHNPYIDTTLEATEKNLVKIGPSWLTDKSNSIDWHFANAFRISIEQALKISIPQGISRPDIWFTKQEFNAPRITEKPYWIICVNGEKGWGCKMYPFVKWQEFVDQNQDVTFVQIGTKEDNPPRLQGPNVIDYVGKTQDRENGIRDLFKLFLNAEGSIGLVSFHMHLSGALTKPAIVVAGGREPVSFTRYPGHAYLSTDGMLPCAVKACWHCDISRCTNPVNKPDHTGNMEIVPRCVDMITPEDLTRALNNFYIGGRLNKTTPSEKPKHLNVVETPTNVLRSAEKEEYINTYGMPWGSGALLKEDWQSIKSLMEAQKVRSVLEFGSGLSTILFADTGRDLISFETNTSWCTKVWNVKPYVNIQHWDGKNFPGLNRYYDLAFVDGPAGPANRLHAMKAAAEYARIVVVHDGNTEIEKEHMALAFGEGFDALGKTGRRCYLFIKKAPMGDPKAIVENRPYKPQENKASSELSQAGADTRTDPGTPLPRAARVSPLTIKVVSTARGWGGAGRSVTTIMDFLSKAGHKVEFIPFRNAVTSSEWKAWLATHPEIKVTENYSTVHERCDVLFMYADDYIWEFDKPFVADPFSNINAGRKVMMLNYRRGRVGEIPWTKGWDKYMFLNSSQEKELLQAMRTADHSEFPQSIKTKVLPPCTILDPFFTVTPDYNHSLRIVRHSSQGDTKFNRETDDALINQIMERPDASISMLPGPSWLPINDRCKKFPRTADPIVIANFLQQGNLFWYSLPHGYMDMGPRVILEAMAAGLPVIADAWGGAVDRVTPETGWLCVDKNEHVDILKHVTAAELAKKGKAARARAASEFVPERWVEEILN